MRELHRRTLRDLVGGVVFSTLLCAACAAVPTRLPVVRAPNVGAGQPLPKAGPADPPDDVSVPDVAEDALESVVNIATTRVLRGRGEGGPYDDPLFRYFFGHGAPEQRAMSLGSGVIYSNDGLILTNNHVIEQAQNIVVTLHDGRVFEAKVVGTDPSSDVAVIRLTQKAGDLRPMPLGDSDALRLGDTVLAIGNPFGLGHTVTEGIVSAKGRADVGINEYEDFIQTDAAINPGNSGGALIDGRGRLVGINTAIVSKTGGFQGIGFAIPVNMVKAVADDLLKYGEVRRGSLGILVQDITPDLAEAMDLRTNEGVLVADLVKGGAAAAAGLQRGDVIESFGGQPVASAGELRNAVALAEPGKQVQVTYLRDGRQRTTTVQIQRSPAQERQVTRRAAPEAPTNGALGIAVAPLDARLRRRLNAPSDLQGLVVTDVDRGSPADMAGLQPGDVIVEAGHHAVTRPEQLESSVRGAKERVLLLVWREGHTQYVVVGRE